MTFLLKRLDDANFLFRAHSGIHRHIFNDRTDIGSIFKFSTGHCPAGDPQFTTDRPSCQLLITGDHHHLDAGIAAHPDRLDHFRSGRIVHRLQTGKNKPLFGEPVIRPNRFPGKRQNS